MDEADDAQKAEALGRAEALYKARGAAEGEPVYDEHGRRICVDCERLIAPARLAAKPTATRCVFCQRKAEEHYES